MEVFMYILYVYVCLILSLCVCIYVCMCDRWAKSRTQCSDEVIETYLRRISCVSQCNNLTFSTFILFAMYVFTSKMSEAVAQTLAENDFVGLIRKVLG